MNFQDHTEIMLSSETKVVTYVNKRGERSTYPLNSAMESANLEMVKRLKYTKDILTHMLNQNAGNINKNSAKPATTVQRENDEKNAEPHIEGMPVMPSAQSTRPGEGKDVMSGASYSARNGTGGQQPPTNF